MSDITLSSAVRSNLLSLQSTADLMSKTQERLATGLKVNSALDNPTNFFTASSLNSRASDLSRLLDGVSNATQTLEAADNGISAITKLVESAQATVRQAQQTSGTIDTVGPATAGITNAGAFTAVDVTGGGSAADAGAVTGTGFSAVNLDPGSAETSATISAGAFSAVDFTNAGSNDGAVSFTLNVDGADQAINITYADVTAQVGAGNENAVGAADLAALINADAGATIASVGGGGDLEFTSTTTGTGSSLTISAFSATNGATGSGIADATIVNGDAAVAGDSLSFDLAVDGGVAQTITLDTAALDQYDAANVGNEIADRTAITADELASVLNQEIADTVPTLGATASVVGGELSIASDTTGASSDVTISASAGSVTGGAIGLGNGTDAGGAAIPATDSISFTLAVDGGADQTITIDDAAVDAYNTANTTTFDSSALTADNIAALINDQATGVTAAVDGTSGNLTFTSGTTGDTSSVAISGYSATVTGGSTGIADGTNSGVAESTVEEVNPKRAEFISQYNEIVGQINELAEDASFNGVNLLDGDDLSVIFNEDGSSQLDISGVTFDSAGLGLSELGTTAFDTDASIDTVLGSLDTAIGSLRSQASEFGSNLSIVETREDFTKATINTLETGAANLTLADTNQEGANLLALQTRQSLSSTALSLASQADQNVLRLF